MKPSLDRQVGIEGSKKLWIVFVGINKGRIITGLTQPQAFNSPHLIVCSYLMLSTINIFWHLRPDLLPHIVTHVEPVCDNDMQNSFSICLRAACQGSAFYGLLLRLWSASAKCLNRTFCSALSP